ncbi:MAG TPA: hypothetical protein VMB21_09465 [Candidatus Limnocylindria bacterium]|jgi:hypothetical protein|nr:hypothetical protein [Candidatus Limnocylindria bacterium]
MLPAGHISLIAAAGTDIPLPSTLDGASRQVLGGTMPVIGALLALVCLLLAWAVFLRKPQGRRERGRLIESKSSSHGSHRSASGGESTSKSGRRRRRREKKRPRNPTLAETGGLPPLGAGDSGSPPL